jgi:hypothetical protein
VELHALGVFPAAGLEAAFHKEGLSLLDVLAAELAQSAPSDQVMEFRKRLGFALRILPEAIGCETEDTNGLTARDGFDLGIVRDVPDEGDFVHRLHK